MWDLPKDEILPALRLSYYLPSSLKQCFAYCAIFPKNYRFTKEHLVLSWIAEDFIVPSGREENMKIGERYFEDLVSRSFFQQQSTTNCYGETVFTMHDLINDLATLVSGEFCSKLEGLNLLKATQRTRYASCLLTQTYYEMDTLNISHIPHSLRTLIFSGDRMPLTVDNEALQKLLLALKSLRVLCVSRGVRVLGLPDSIGILKHLRFLNLQESYLKQLPESICNLYNMQILILKGCSDLTKLPDNLRKLVNLILLDIGRTQLHEMPPYMGQLTKLQKLSNFVVGKQRKMGSNSSINELGKLCNLQGRLCIRGLQNVVDDGDAMEANLKGKQRVEELRLEWGDKEENGNCSLHQEQVLEDLVPHRDLKILAISGYRGERFVDWVGDSSFSCMESLELFECKIRSLPPLWQLGCLEKLIIYRCSRITSIGSELHSMKKLKHLEFFDVQEWCEWISDGDDSDTNFPLLQEFEVRFCPKLKKALPSHLPSITKIEIHSCEQLEMESFLLECFPKLEVLEVRDCPKLVSFCKGRSPNFSSNLASLTLDNCPNLKVLPEYCLCSNLEILWIGSCSEIESFPTTLQVNLGGSISKLRELKVWNCKKLFSRRHEWGLEMLPSLVSLTIGGCDDESVEESFPEKTLLPSTLTSLTIWDLPNLKSLNYEGLQHLTSLTKLEIRDCPKLQSLLPNQNQKLPSSLSSLAIDWCPLLKERCKREKKEDWPKIAHIPNIYFDGKRIS